LKTAFSNRRPDRTVVFAGWFAILVSVAEVIVDLGTWVELDIATIYGIPLVLAAFARDRRLLWGLTAALMLVTFIAYGVQIPNGSFAVREALFVNRALDAVALLLIAGLLQIWMTSLDVRDACSISRRARLGSTRHRAPRLGPPATSREHVFAQ